MTIADTKAAPADHGTPTNAAHPALRAHDRPVNLTTANAPAWGSDVVAETLRALEDALLEFVFGHQATPAEKLDGMVDLLNTSMVVVAGPVGDGTVTIDLDWPDAQMAFDLVEAAQQAFLDARQAADSLETATQLAADSPEPYYVLASAYRQLHEDDKADAALKAFNARKKTDADQRAREMRSRADYEEGVNLLSNTDRLDKAYESLAKAVSELPTFDPGYYRLAQVSYLKGDLQNALASIRRALQLNPLEPEYYYVLARCLEDTDPPASLEAIRKAIGFRPGVPDFEDLLRELNSKAASKSPSRNEA